MRGRFRALFLLGLYALISTHSIYVALEVLYTTESVELNQDFPCAGHDCGCESAEQCRTNCCCFPSRRAVLQENLCCGPSRERKEPSFKSSYAAVPLCFGHTPENTASDGPKRTVPHLWMCQSLPAADENAEEKFDEYVLFFASIDLEPPEKIPKHPFHTT